ncbi:MAG: DNA recombination protein RmuC [Terriglobales bacterium]
MSVPAGGFWFLLGIAVGAGLSWLLLQRSRQNIAAQIKDVAGPELKQLGAEAVHQVQTTEAGLQARLQEMQTRLEQYQTRITDFEKDRAGAAARLEQQLQQMAGTGAAMAQEARSLREALAGSNSVRGAWGESVLQNILNACGLNEQIDYDLQRVLPDGSRPDAVLYLPSGRTLAVDAKASLSDFLAGLAAADEKQRRACFAAFAKVLKARAKELAGKNYCANLERSLPFLAMFVPSESAFRAALDADADLILYGQRLQPPVLLASPTTLFPMVALIAQGWQQYKAAERMQELLQQIAELGKRLQTFLGHVQGVGKALDEAGKAFNAAGASYRSRLTPQLERLQEGGAGWDVAAELKPVEHLPQLEAKASAAIDGRGARR